MEDPARRRGTRRRRACCNAVFRSCCRFWTFVSFFILVGVAAELIYYYTESSELNTNFDFSWSYNPAADGLVPFNSSYSNYNIRLDGHSHLVSFNEEETIRWHIANGYNAMIVTEHNDVEPSLKVREKAREKFPTQMLVITGQEWSTCRCHLGLIGINKTIPSVANPTDADIISAINQTHQQGGLVVVNHYIWSKLSLQNVPTRQQFMSWGADYFEVINENTFDWQTIAFAQNQSLGQITGTDLHNPLEEGVYAWTILSSANFKEEDLWDEIKAKRTSFLYNPLGTNSTSYFSDKTTTYGWVFDPYYKIANYINSYYSFEEPMWSFNDSYCDGYYGVTVYWQQILIAVAWLIISFILFESIRYLISACWRACRRRRRLSKHAYSPIQIGSSDYNNANWFDQMEVEEANK